MEQNSIANKDSKEEISLHDLIDRLYTNQNEISSNNPTPAIEYFGLEVNTDDEILIHKSKSLTSEVIFKECIFRGKNCISILLDEKIIFKKVSFVCCEFTDEIVIHSGINMKELVMLAVEAKQIRLLSGRIDLIKINCSNIEKLVVSNTEFYNLILNDTGSLGGTINELNMFFYSDLKRSISVSSYNIYQIYITGYIRDTSVTFCHSQCNNLAFSKFVNNGLLDLYNIKPIKDAENPEFKIQNSNLNEAKFYLVHFAKYSQLCVFKSKISDCLFINCSWRDNIDGGGALATIEEIEKAKKSKSKKNKKIKNNLAAIRDAYKQLKIAMSNQDDKIQAAKFYAQELNYYDKLLEWDYPWKNIFWDKVIINLSYYLSDFGQSFGRPLFYLIVGHTILFLIAVALHGFDLFQISFSNYNSSAFELAFEQYFIYINPFRSIATSLGGFLILLDIIMRIWSSYMLYNMVRASRRFIL